MTGSSSALFDPLIRDLDIGSELADSAVYPAFLREACPLEDADITAFGGWRADRASLVNRTAALGSRATRPSRSRPSLSIGRAINGRRAREEDARRRRAIDTARRAVHIADEVGERVVAPIRLLIIAHLQHEARPGLPAVRALMKMGRSGRRRKGEKRGPGEATANELHGDLLLRA